MKKVSPTILACSLMATGLLSLPNSAFANDVEIVETRFEKSGDTWTVHTTLRHNDTGWDHYADKWRVIDRHSKTLGERVLFHPHENEQPFTRSQSGIRIPDDVPVVYVEAHDKVHGWSKQRVLVDLRRDKGARYTVSR